MSLVGFSGPPDPALLERMLAPLVHRGREPRVTAELVGGSVAVVPRHPLVPGRIAASGVAAAGAVALALDGYLLGTPADPRTPAQLLERYLEVGIGFVEQLRGAFALAVLDRGAVHLVRDGAGVRTLYHARHGGRFLWALEPKGILAVPGFPRRVRAASVAAYLSFSFVPGAATMLEGLEEVEAGSRVEWRDGEVRKARWFRFEEDEGSGAERSADEWVETFAAEFSRAVRERRPAGAPVGALLSGGLDSSAVVAELAAQHDAPVHTWSLHFGPEHPSELVFSAPVAERAGTHHQEVLLRPRDFLPRLRRIIWHLDDPIGDPITVPNFELAARVSREVSWLFNGEGGDPLFGGPKNLPLLLSHWYGGIEQPPGFRERAYLASYRRSYEEWPRLLRPAWRDQVDAARDLEGILTPFFEAEPPRLFLNKLCAANIRLKGAHLILPKVDRMTAAWGLTPLSPLFDERLIRLSFAMPPLLKLDSGIEKGVIKRAFAGRLPESVLTRPKSGMRVPVHEWMRGDMSRYARKVLSKKELARAGIFDPARVQQLLDYRTEEGPGRYGLRLWMLLTFEIWRRIVVEGEPV